MNNIDFYPALNGAYSSYSGEESNASGCGIKPICVTNTPQAYMDRNCKQVPFPCFKNGRPTTCYKEACIQVPKVRMVLNQDCVNKHKIYSDCLAMMASGGGDMPELPELPGETLPDDQDSSQGSKPKIKDGGTEKTSTTTEFFAKNKTVLILSVVLLVIIIAAILLLRKKTAKT